MSACPCSAAWTQTVLFRVHTREVICTGWIETKPATANKRPGELQLLPAAALVPLAKAEQELSSHPSQAAPLPLSSLLLLLG